MKKVYLKDLQPDEVIRRLKAGEILKEKESDTYVKVVNGVICTFYENGDIGLNDNIIFNLKDETSMYFEEPEEFKLEVYHTYKARNGHQIIIFGKNIVDYDFPMSGFDLDSKSVGRWKINGKYGVKAENNLDLISEWSDDDVAKD